MDHAIRIPEMGVSKVPLTFHQEITSFVCVLWDYMTLLTELFLVPVPCRGLL